MNLAKLKHAEYRFLQKYPQGFMHPEMLALAKKHKMDSMIAYAQQEFGKSNFKNEQAVITALTKCVSRSSMVSMFEKPRFRDFAAGLSAEQQHALATALKLFLHGKQQQGFELLTAILATERLAKWSLVTIVPNYYAPLEEVFVKPTTAKGVIEYFELEELHYTPTPNWDFYSKYRAAIVAMKAQVAASLAPNNAAFGGFLMMSMGA